MTSKITSLVINSNDKIYSSDTHDNFTVDVNLGSFIEPDDERYFVRVDAMSAIVVQWGGNIKGADLLLGVPHSLDVLCPSMPQYQSYNTGTGTESQSLTVLNHDDSDSYHPPPYQAGSADPSTKMVLAQESWKKTYEVDSFMLRREVVQNKRWRFQLKFTNDPTGTLLSRSRNFQALDGTAAAAATYSPSNLAVSTQPWQMRLTVSK